jgi:hypothetical protein
LHPFITVHDLDREMEVAENKKGEKWKKDEGKKV